MHLPSPGKYLIVKINCTPRLLLQADRQASVQQSKQQKSHSIEHNFTPSFFFLTFSPLYLKKSSNQYNMSETIYVDNIHFVKCTKFHIHVQNGQNLYSKRHEQ